MAISLPFLYFKENDERPDDKKWFVKIASSIDYVTYWSGWMQSRQLGDYCLIPDMDICDDIDDIHEFVTEELAVKFIRKWWKDN
jgi:hypothetical protein